MLKKFLPVVLVLLLFTGCGETAKSPYGDELMLLQQENIYTLDDGCQVSRWSMGMMNQDYYCIEDEDGDLQEILVVDIPVGPEGVKNNGLCFDDLNETAKTAIATYYEQQGVLYDVEAELEPAYEDYLIQKEKNRVFEWHYFSQTIWPTGANDEIIAFCTELISYRGEENYRQDWFNVVFDRETGEQIEIESLFIAPEDEVRTVILDHLMPEDPDWSEKNLWEQMEQAFSFDFIKLMNDGIEVMFPVDTLECKEEAFGGFIPAEELSGIMQVWTK